MSVRDRKGENRGKISPIIFMCVAGLSLVLLKMLFEFQILFCLTYAPLAFESLVSRSFIPPPS